MDIVKAFKYMLILKTANLSNSKVIFYLLGGFTKVYSGFWECVSNWAPLIKIRSLNPPFGSNAKTIL